MKKIRIFNFFAFIINLALFCAPCFFIGKRITSWGYEHFANMFEFLSAKPAYVISAVLGIMALIIIPFNIASIYSGKVKTPKAILIIKLVLTTVTFAVFAFNLYSSRFTPVFTRGFEILAIYALVPLLAFINFAFFETGKKFGWGWIFFGLISALYYAVFYIKGFPAKIVKLLGINIYLSTSLEFYVTLAIFAVGGVLIAFILWLLNSLLSKEKTVKETTEQVEEPTETVEEEPSEQIKTEETTEQPSEEKEETVEPIVDTAKTEEEKTEQVEEPTESVVEETTEQVEEPTESVVEEPIEEEKTEQVEEPSEKEEQPTEQVEEPSETVEEEPTEQVEETIEEVKEEPLNENKKENKEENKEEPKKPATKKASSTKTSTAKKTATKTSASKSVTTKTTAKKPTQKAEEEKKETVKPANKKTATTKAQTQEKKETPASVKSETATKTTAKKTENKEQVLYKDKSRVYHISKNDDGKWQVKLANGEKAIKLFDTQLLAINYAKELVKTRGGSIRIHSLKGKIRK